MNKQYSDRRWRDAPKAYPSECSSCTNYRGYAKCAKYPEGIPREVLKQSALGTESYNKKYCDMKKLKKS